MAKRPYNPNAKRADIPQPGDITIAHKAISLMPDLSAAEKAVAAAIVDHCNKVTGQCDPSVERLATLLGIDRATVVRATRSLSHTGKKAANKGRPALFIKHSHGGGFHRAFYQPRWDCFRLFNEVWEGQSKAKFDQVSKSNSAKLRTWWARKCALDRRENAHQYHLIKPSNDTIEVSEPRKLESETKTSNQKPPSKRVAPSQGFGRGKGTIIRKPPSSAVVAESIAQDKIDKVMQSHGSEVYQHLVEHLDAQDYAEWTSLEMNKAGAGVLQVKHTIAALAFPKPEFGKVA